MLRKILLSAFAVGACAQAPAHHGISNWDLNQDLPTLATLTTAAAVLLAYRLRRTGGQGGLT